MNSANNTRLRKARKSRFIQLPGIKQDISHGRTIHASVGDSEINIMSSEFDKLSRKLGHFNSHSVKMIVSRRDCSLHAHMKHRSNVGWLMDPTKIDVNVSGSYPIRVSFFHPSLPAPIIEDITLVTSMQTDPVNVRFDSDIQTIFVYPNDGWCDTFGKVEFRGPTRNLTNKIPWVDISDCTQQDPYSIKSNLDSDPDQYCLVRIGGETIHPYSLQALSSSRHWSQNVGNMIPTLVDIFEIPDHEWVNYISSILNNMARENKHFGSPDGTPQKLLRDRVKWIIYSAVFGNSLYKPCSDFGSCDCVYCKAKQQFFDIGGPTGLLKLIKKSGNRVWEDIPSELRFVFPLAMLDPLRSGSIREQLDEHGGEYVRFFKKKYGDSQHFLIPRGGLLFHNIWEPVEHHSSLRKNLRGWTCGIPLRMEFKFNDYHLTVDWVGILQYGGIK